MVRALSSVTVGLTVTLMVLKSAMRLTPLATAPPLQLLLVLQLPLALFVHVPLM